jgi:SH3-like domain-containing protein
MTLRIIITVLFIAFFAAYPTSADAGDKKDGFRATDLPLPRFVSLSSGKVHSRTGPALRYPVRWMYTRRGLPVEIIREFDTWRKIRDVDGEVGWVHQSLISGKRTVIIDNNTGVPMYNAPSNNAPVIAKVEPEVILDLDTCEENWCRLEAQGFKGWVQRNYLWGIYENEEFD